MIKRNMPCPCGSNIKYKKCCGKEQSSISQPDFDSDPNKSPASTTEFYREQEAAKQQTQNHTNHQLPKHKSAQEYYELGAALVSKGLLHDAIECFQGALAIQPAAEVYFNLAVIQERVGNLQESVDSCLEALSLKPGLDVVHRQLGSLFQKMGNFEEAISAYKEALMIQPDQVEIHNSIGAVQRETGLFDEAETSFLKALSIRSDYEMASLNLASLYLQQEKTEEAIDCCRKSLVINPDSALLYFCLAEIYEQNGDLEKAFLNLNRAYDLDHNINECLILKARLFIKEGKMDLASKQLAEIKINESDSSYLRWQKYYLQGKSYICQDFMEGALGSFIKALATDIE
ncbi:tetratricopeptide repeat protein [Candidatus Woesearchaeota archaeon]|nr:tetratricopeptide repeat protein [Candidatus Woesearchaeota archaeon]